MYSRKERDNRQREKGRQREGEKAEVHGHRECRALGGRYTERGRPADRGILTERGILADRGILTERGRLVNGGILTETGRQAKRRDSQIERQSERDGGKERQTDSYNSFLPRQFIPVLMRANCVSEIKSKELINRLNFAATYYINYIHKHGTKNRSVVYFKFSKLIMTFNFPLVFNLVNFVHN
jgi:hypothetical protein